MLNAYKVRKINHRDNITINAEKKINIYKGYNTQTNNPVIIKQYSFSVFDQTQLENYYNKLVYIKSLNCENIINIIEVVKCNEFMTIVTQNNEHILTSVKSHLKNNFMNNEQEFKNIFKQIFTLLYFIKLKLNIPDEDFNINTDKILRFLDCDQNNSKILLTENVVEPRHWIYNNPRENICEIEKILSISNIFSDIGIILYQVFVENKLLREILDENRNIIWCKDIGNTISNNLKQFIEKLCNKTQPTMLECLKDKWFTTNDKNIVSKSNNIFYIKNYF